MRAAAGRAGARHGTRLLAVTVAVGFLALPEATAAQTLEILLTNDDGYRAPGIVAVRDALIAAGHRVTIVAPDEHAAGSDAAPPPAAAATHRVSKEAVSPAIGASSRVSLEVRRRRTNRP